MFRVWALNATSVSVAGSFNNWDMNAAPLEHEGSGYWSADVAGAAVSDTYKFVIRSPYTSAPLWKNDPYARSVTKSDGESIIAETDYAWSVANYRTPGWDELVIYELHVGTFNADPHHPGRRGTFASVATKLDYLQDLGINAIQILPADEFPFDVSWGYNPSHIFAIEQSYGGPNGLRLLVDEAHRRGIAVLFDVVYNHFGPTDLDLWRFDGWSESSGGGIYFYNDWRRQTPWGDTRPDYGRGEVRQFIRDNVLRWLEQRQCDGLRFDATGWIRNVWGADNDAGADLPEGRSLLQWLNSEMQRRQPWKITIAEDMQDNPWITRSTASGGAGFGSQWGAGFMHALRTAVAASRDEDRDMDALARVVAQRFNASALQRVVYTESHDEAAGARVPEIIWPGAADSAAAQKRSTLAATLIFTAPGIPMIFMGQEFLSGGHWSDAQMLDWSMADRFAGIRVLYHDLIRLRRNWFDHTAGLRGNAVNVYHVNHQDKVLAFHRWHAGGARDDVVVLANFSANTFPVYTIGLPRAGLWKVRFNGDWGGYSAAFGNTPSQDAWTVNESRHGLPCAASFGIGAYSAIILSQDA